MSLQEEIKKRRTFAIISHPDAGKTTITEQLLYFGVRFVKQVRSREKTGNFAKSDWMDIEKQRGISVTSSVMQFDYAGKRVNILDTPGHEDFSEDTYRTLMAVDAAVMVVDSAKGIEAQTKSSLRLLSTATFLFSLLSTSWTVTVVSHLICCRSWKKSWALPAIQ